MLGVHWESSGAARRDPSKARLAVFEVKYGDAALSGTAGLVDHINDLNAFLEADGAVEQLRADADLLFQQKHALGLIDTKHRIKVSRSETPLYVLVLIDHDPDSRILLDTLRGLPRLHGASLRFATSTMMGFGLFEQGVVGQPTLERRHASQIHSKPTD